MAVTAGQLPAVWGLMALTLAIIYVMPRFTKVVPSALVAILISTGISIRMGLDVPTVSSLGTLPSGLPQFGIPQVPFTTGTLGLILPTALAISLVGLMETFLTQDILDDVTDSSSHKNQEARGQGIGNIVSSFFGGMAGCALVGQSVMNVGYGGRTRLSTLTSGVSLLAMILLASQWVNQIPMATLVGVMVMIAINTANWDSIRSIRRIPKSDTSVMLLTVVVTVLTHNLAVGLLSGVALAGILFSRKVGRTLGLPEEIVGRHPFPGPGLAIRILGEVTDDKLDILRDADLVVREEIKAAGLYHDIWQAFAVLLPVRSVGVMGDKRTYAFPIVLRCVSSEDGMTADWSRLPYDLLEKISNRIVNEVKGVNRVVLDITSKPPGTIEWE